MAIQETLYDSPSDSRNQLQFHQLNSGRTLKPIPQSVGEVPPSRLTLGRHRSRTKITSAGFPRSASYDENQTAFLGNPKTVFLPAFAPPGSRKNSYRNTKISCSLDPFYQYTEMSEDDIDEDDPDCMSIGQLRAIVKEHLIKGSVNAAKEGDQLCKREQTRKSDNNGAPLSLLQLAVRYSEHNRKFEKEKAHTRSKDSKMGCQLFHFNAGRSIPDIVHGAATFTGDAKVTASIENSFKFRLLDKGGIFKESVSSVVQQPEIRSKGVAQARLQPLSLKHHSGLEQPHAWAKKRSASPAPQHNQSRSVSTLKTDVSQNLGLQSTETPVVPALLQAKYLPIPGYLQPRVFSPLPLAHTLAVSSVSKPQQSNVSSTGGTSSTTLNKAHNVNSTTQPIHSTLPKLVIVPHCASSWDDTDGSEDESESNEEDTTKMATMDADRSEPNINGNSGVPSLSRELDVHRINFDSCCLGNNGVRMKFLLNKPFSEIITSASNAKNAIATNDV